MERLIHNASQMTEAQEELNLKVDDGSLAFDNIVRAIQVVQKNQGILGTTSMEAATTIEGSAASARAAWDNLLTGIGANDPKLISSSVSGLVDSLFGTFKEETGKREGGMVRNLVNTYKNVFDAIGTNGYSIVKEAARALADAANDLFGIDLSDFGTSFDEVWAKVEDWRKKVADALGKVAEGFKNFVSQIDTGTLASIAETIGSLFDKALGFITENGDEIGTILGVVANAILKVVDAGLKIMDFLSPFLPAIVGVLAALQGFAIVQTIVGFVTTLSTVFGALGTVIATFGGPLAAIAALFGGLPVLLAAAVAAVVAFVLSNEELRNKIGEVIGAIGDFFTSLPEKFAELQEKFAAWQEEVRAKFDEWWGGIKSGWTDLTENVKKSVEDGNKQVSEAWDNWQKDVREKFDTWWKAVQDGWKLLTDNVKKNVDDGNNAISTSWDSWQADTRAKFDSWWSSMKAGWQSFTGNLHSTWENAKNGIQNAWSNLYSNVTSIMGNIRSGISSQFSNMVENVKGYGNSLISFVTGIPDRIASGFRGLRDLLWNAGYNIMNGLWDGLEYVANQMFDWISGIADTIAWLKGPLPYDRKVLVDNGVALMTGLEKGMQKSFEGSVLPYVDTMAKSISDAMTLEGSFATRNIASPYAQGTYQKAVNVNIEHMEVREEEDIYRLSNRLSELVNREEDATLWSA